MPDANGNLTTEEYIDRLTQLSGTPQGQAAARAQQQTIEMNVRQAVAAMQNERDRIAITRGQAEANAWYQREQAKLAQQVHQLAVQTQQQNNAIQQGQLTGSFNGEPTLAALGQQGQMTGTYQGQPTLAAQQQQALLSGVYQGNPTLAARNQAEQLAIQQGTMTGLYNGAPTLANQISQQNFGLNQAGVTGSYQGAPTLAAINQQQQYGLQQRQAGLNEAGVTGYMNGAPTMANQQFATNASGYLPGGQATLAREQNAANTALEAGRLGASLRGPGDWAQYLQEANMVAGSPASALVASAPGGMGMAAGDGGGPMTLARLLGDYGVMPGQGPSQQTGMPMPGPQPVPQPAQQPVMGRPQNGQGVFAGVPGQYAEGGGPMADPAQQMFAGGTPGFNEQTGSYSSAPTRSRTADTMGGLGWQVPAPSGGGVPPGMTYHQGQLVPISQVYGVGATGLPQQPQSNAWTPATGGVVRDPMGMPTWMPPQGQQRPGATPPDASTLQGAGSAWNPYSMTGAIGQAAAAPRVTNAQLGLSDQEAGTLQNYFQNPNQAPGTWWASKSPTQRTYLSGLGEYWGHDMETFKSRERNARPRQASPFAAV